MESILINLTSADSIIIPLTGIITAALPIFLLLAIIIRFVTNMESTFIYRAFKFPKDIKKYKEMKNILKVLSYTCIQLFLFGVICHAMMFYYLIYYGIFLPRLYGVNPFW